MELCAGSNQKGKYRDNYKHNSDSSICKGSWFFFYLGINIHSFQQCNQRVTAGKQLDAVEIGYSRLITSLYEVE